MVNYNTKYNRIKLPANDTVKRHSRVDLTGFISKEKRIAYLIEAGERLPRSKGLYDFDKEVDIDDVECDPTRRKSFDYTDAQEMYDNRVIPTYVKLRKEALERKKNEDNARKAALEQNTAQGASKQE